VCRVLRGSPSKRVTIPRPQRKPPGGDKEPAEARAAEGLALKLPHKTKKLLLPQQQCPLDLGPEFLKYVETFIYANRGNRAAARVGQPISFR
jgi:hypothetical protein